MVNVPLLLIAAVLLLAPLTGFMKFHWLTAVLEVCPLAVLCGWLLVRRQKDKAFSLPPGSAALLLLVAWGLLQLIPLPALLAKALSPYGWENYHQSLGALAPSAWTPLSLNPRATLQAVLTLCSGCACFFMVASLVTEQKTLKRCVLWLTGIGGGLAIGVILLRLLSLILAWSTSPTGKIAVFLELDLTPFALLLLLLGPLALATLLVLRPTARYGSLLERLETYWQATVQDHFLIVVLSVLVIPFAIALLHWPSMFFFLGALCLLWLMLTFKKKGRRESPYILLLIVVGLLATVIGIGNGYRSAKPALATAPSDRGQATTGLLVKKFQMTGSGLGTYDQVYRRYDRRSFQGPTSSANGMPLSRGRVEAGWPFILLGGWFCAALLWRTLARWRSRRNKMAIYLYIGILAGLAAFAAVVAIMGLQVPVWLRYYCFALAGLLAAACQLSKRTLADDFFPEIKDWRLSLGRVLAVFFLLASVLFHGGSGLAKGLMANSSVPGQHESEAKGAFLPPERLLAHAIFYDPLNAVYRRTLAWRLVELGRHREARARFIKGLRLDPLAGLQTYRLGMYLDDSGDHEMAIRLMQHGLQGDWDNTIMQTDFVTRLMLHGSKPEALNHVRQILTTAPERTLDWLYFFDRQGFPVTAGSTILADHPRCLVDYGDFLLQKDQTELASENFHAALDFMQSNDTFSPELVSRVAIFFETRQQYEKALTAVLAGARVYPEDLDIMRDSGRLYERLGLTLKAAKIYRQVLMHVPQDLEIRRQLQRLEALQ